MTNAPRPWLLGALALLVVAVAYSNALAVGFMWDDHVLIEQNTELHALQAPWAYFTRGFWDHAFLQGSNAGYYRPLVTLSFAVDWWLASGSPVPFHLTNLLLHLAVCAVVFRFALARSGDAVTAAVVCSLFGVLPRLTESVTWIAGRTDVLATLFVLLAVSAAESSRPRVRQLAALCWLAALFSKEVALVALPLLFVRGSKKALREAAPFVAALLLWAALRALGSPSTPLALHDARTVLAAFGTYVQLLATPWDPVLQLGFVLDPPGWAVALGVVALAAAGGLVAWWARRDGAWRSAWLLAAVAALGMVSLVKLSVFTLASDRYLYLPLALGAVLATHRPWPRAAIGLGIAGALALGLVTFRHNALWGDPVAFWSVAHRRADPRNPGPAMGLADVLFERGRYEEARALYLAADVAQGARPDAAVRLSLAVVDSKLGRDAEALERLRALLDADPRWRRARYDLVLFRARALDFDGARAALREVRAEFGADPVLDEFASLLDETSRALREGAPLEQARALHRLGATAKAERRYLELLEQPATRAESAAWLVAFAGEPSARRGLEALGVDEAARQLFEDRFQPVDR